MNCSFPFSGDITLVGQLDASGKKSYSLLVVVTDTVHIVNTTVTILVTESECPSWEKGSLSIRIKENASIGHMVGQLKTANHASLSTNLVHYGMNETSKSLIYPLF